MEITAINNLPMAAAPNGAGDVVPSPETHEEKDMSRPMICPAPTKKLRVIQIWL